MMPGGYFCRKKKNKTDENEKNNVQFVLLSTPFSLLFRSCEFEFKMWISNMALCLEYVVGAFAVHDTSALRRNLCFSLEINVIFRSSSF